MLITLKFSAILFTVILLSGTIPSSLNFATAEDGTKPSPPIPHRPNFPHPFSASLSTSVGSPLIHAASTFTAVQNGDWNSGATWNGTVPGESDDKIIPLGINVTVTTPTNNTGIITNSGNLIILNSGTNSYGIKNTGTITNSGKITVSNFGNNSIGINSTGNISNFGTIKISNTNLGTGGSNGSRGIFNDGGIITNNSGGLMTISNSGDSSLGIDNLNAINNNSGGQVKVSNNGTSSTGISSDGGAINNNSGGLVTVSNSGPQSQGIYNVSFSNLPSTIISFGTVNILNNGTMSIGIIIGNTDNYTNNSGGLITITNFASANTNTGIDTGGSLRNSGAITVSNIGSTTRGILNEQVGGIINSGKIDNSGWIDNKGNLTNFGTITISNSNTGSIGLTNNGTLNNSGIISINTSGSNSIGIENSSGKTITNSGTISIKNSPSSSSGIENNAATINNSGTISMENPVATYNNIHNTGNLNNFGTIYNCFGHISPNDPTNPVVVCPPISINNVPMTEGNSGTKNFNFTVTRSGVTTGTSYVNYTTSPGTAIPNSDYIPKSGNLTFSGDQTIKTITIPVIGDIIVEQNETFNVNLLNCVGCSITNSPGIGTIQNDDLGCSPPGQGDWTISSSCILASSSSAPRNVIVLSGAVLTIPTGLSLNIDFTQFHLLVNSGGTVLIKAGGAIK